MLAAGVIASGSVVAAVLGAALLILSYAWSPRGYEVGEQCITVKRLIASVRIPLVGVRQLRPARCLEGDWDPGASPGGGRDVVLTGPPSYTLTPRSLTNHNRFYPATPAPGSVDVDHVRVVDLDMDAE